MSVSDAPQLAIGVGLLIINLIGLVVELIKSQQKNNRLSLAELAII
ncbi:MULTISPECIES: putative holin-like toxin [Lactobacillaceae]|uniref:Uncharacterized protein n=1 Tax=Lentilactobacillus hilgardii (strain ATCC 8290 / DSM 20176 / CCUG 30140 / JCM 1155 / KCTC 3500 / NBRC 15886 / NCIMB 8040 / NRRL B-1843 / 9) TaxID=1423757 RepID=C0XGL5_LENH9|nr:putative holin-like toxin [Lentilactobacillus parabuchneri]EEI25427.1 hypothetical protein HMPREF0519_0376 [Lentilactobacillus hilgardii DSM 20176 = ATCC 8290]MCT3558583.1 putative holin-like toxin [Lentilactobacillus buchneri]PUD95405.1 putative holin-like toxin [Levilactobacillus brevis]QEU39426.1 putative holin-like toxin [Lentilactobacillus hilgardii]MBW0223995.1 putative holin-like toxin [Lentilactobacillus parabuchneri]